VIAAPWPGPRFTLGAPATSSGDQEARELLLRWTAARTRLALVRLAEVLAPLDAAHVLQGRATNPGRRS
jgi:hypothetical protein